MKQSKVVPKDDMNRFIGNGLQASALLHKCLSKAAYGGGKNSRAVMEDFRMIAECFEKMVLVQWNGRRWVWSVKRREGGK